MADIDLAEAPAITRRDMLEKAKVQLAGVVHYGINLGLKPDETDCRTIREAYALLCLALREDR